MFDIHATLNGTTWDIGEDLQDNATRAEAEESAQIWLDRLTAAERNSATVEIVEIAELNPDPADDVTGNGIECHYDLARQLEMRGYTVDADSEDNEHSYVRFADEHVGDIHGDAVATVTTKGTTRCTTSGKPSATISTASEIPRCRSLTIGSQCQSTQ